jgi:hypothetical protein
VGWLFPKIVEPLVKCVDQIGNADFPHIGVGQRVASPCNHMKACHDHFSHWFGAVARHACAVKYGWSRKRDLHCKIIIHIRTGFVVSPPDWLSTGQRLAGMACHIVDKF